MHIDGWRQERRNSFGNALELRLSCIYSSVYSIMYGLAWIPIFGSRMRSFSHDFSEWRSGKWKIIGESPHVWQKIVIHGEPQTSLLITNYFVLQSNDRSDITRTWSSAIVTSSSTIVFALTNWHRIEGIWFVNKDIRPKLSKCWTSSQQTLGLI